jgi:hypothetical protein
MAHWHLVLRSSWDLEATINDWIDLMVDDIVVAVLIDLLLLSWHSRLSSLEWNLVEVFLVEA